MARQDRPSLKTVRSLPEEVVPGAPSYQRMTGKPLRAALAELGIRVPSVGNRYSVDPLTMRHILTQRATSNQEDAKPS